jgi:hypothetical protein
MVRIAGIDKDFTNLELLFLQAEDSEKMELAAGYIAQTAAKVGEFEIKVELTEGQVIMIKAANKKGNEE